LLNKNKNITVLKSKIFLELNNTSIAGRSKKHGAPELAKGGGKRGGLDLKANRSRNMIGALFSSEK